MRKPDIEVFSVLADLCMLPAVLMQPAAGMKL